MEQSANHSTQTPVFVYGTLRTGQSNHGCVERWLKTAATATVRGLLYHLDEGYPTMISGQGTIYGEGHSVVSGEGQSLIYGEGERTIYGEVMEFTHPKEALEAMDVLEGYEGPGKDNLYERIIVQATLSDGRQTSCLAYVFPLDRRTWLESNAIHIPGGDWVEYMRDKGDDASHECL